MRSWQTARPARSTSWRVRPKSDLGALAGDEGLINEGQLERFKGQFKETIASVSEMAESRSKDAAETIKAKLDEETRRG